MRIFFFSLITLLAFSVSANNPVDTSYWKYASGFGLSLDQGLIINPRIGAGANRIGAGGLLTWSGVYEKGLSKWDNKFGGVLAAQRLGAGLLAEGSDERVPFTKNTDNLRFSSSYNHSFNATSKWSLATIFTAESQLLPTYTGNIMRDLGPQVKISDLFSPAILSLGVGLGYKANEHLSFYYSPVAYRGIFVANKDIAELKSFTPNGEQAFHSFGSNLVMKYNNKYFGDRLLVNHTWSLFNNYLQDPENLVVDFQNNLQYEIVKGLSLGLLVNLMYDHNIRTQITDYSYPNGVVGVTLPDDTYVPTLGRKTSIIQSMFLKYTRTF